VGGEPVTAAELDATIALRLHDFDMARYELRAAQLRELLLSRVLGPGAAADGVSIAEYVRRQAAAAGLTDAAFVDAAFERAGVTIELTPPDPPIVDVSVDDDPVRGNGDAPITIVLFCDFQSPYCRAMQPVLQRLLAAYPTQVRLVERDFPLPLHREAQPAAEAAECARRQGGYWPYHDALLQAPGDLGRAALSAHAQRIGIDVARLVACLDAHEARAEVDADAADARRLGLSVVPTTFVDGRYLRGPQTYEALRAQVDAALRRRGLPVPSPRSAPLPRRRPRPRRRRCRRRYRCPARHHHRATRAAFRRAPSPCRERSSSRSSPTGRGSSGISSIPPPISARATSGERWYGSVPCGRAACTRRWACRRATWCCASTARCCSTAAMRCSTRWARDRA
jgi:protein-disulfide isomerase